MKRPLRVRVLGKQYDLAYVPPDSPKLMDGEDALVGQCDSEKQRILIAEGQPLESEQDTVLHEVLHAVDFAMSGVEDAPEAVIRRLATGFLAVIKDNPSFVKYLSTKARVNDETLPQA